MCCAICDTSMPGNWCRIETKGNSERPSDRFPARDPRHRGHSAPASAPGCKQNSREAWPALRTLESVDSPVIPLSPLASSSWRRIGFVSFAFSLIMVGVRCDTQSEAHGGRRQCIDPVLHLFRFYLYKLLIYNGLYVWIYS